MTTDSSHNAKLYPKLSLSLAILFSFDLSLCSLLPLLNDAGTKRFLVFTVEALCIGQKNTLSLLTV